MNIQEPENFQPIQPVIPQHVIQMPEQNFVQPVSSSSHKGRWAIIIILLLLIGVGSAFAAYHYGLFTLPMESTTTSSAESTLESPVTTTDTTTATNANCDNYQCLISAASQCKPISVTISYSGVPTIGFIASGQTKYGIKKSSGVNDCILTFSSPFTFFSLYDEGRAVALAQGMTDAQITAQLQTINDSLKSAAGTQTICQSKANIITSYLTDAEKRKIEFIGSDLDLTGQQTQTATYTTSSGQKLVCTVISS